ncbi:uncharacterized protein LOC111310086 isoform X3 [Durio zibethinus]|uniref:Uncharacterized protein LOC111310086 isoform X3 n=1 Tax=Durio zibethinus TaxID=66656 RepID=A0A6P6AJG5_DURZI|nr:uncharacterized protein LOC111310086 isoform X3 [Durio zibethinus]
MRTLAAQLNTLLFKRKPWNVQSRNFSSSNGKVADQASLEQEAERKIGWLLKLFFAGTATFVAYQFFPYMDQRRMKIVEIGGAQELLHMLGSAKDECTQKEALKALSALSKSDEAVKALHSAGAISVIKSTPDTFEDAEIGTYKTNLLKRFQDLRYDISS